MDDIEDFIIIDKRIDAAEEQVAGMVAESLRDRWEFGRLMLVQRVGKQLPKGMLAELSAATGKGQRELKYRMQFAERYPTEDEVGTAVPTFASWNQARASLPKPKPKDQAQPAAPPARHARSQEIIELSGEGLTRAEIAEKIGVGERTVRRELELNALVEATRAEAVQQAGDSAPVPWESLPGTATEKLEGLKRRLTREMERSFMDQVNAEAKKEVDRRLENWRIGAMKTAAELDAIRKAHRGVFTKREYALIRSCLHPDSRLSISDEKLAEAFRVFNEAEMVIRDTRDEPSVARSLPTDLRDLKRRTR